MLSGRFIYSLVTGDIFAVILACERESGEFLWPDMFCRKLCERCAAAGFAESGYAGPDSEEAVGGAAKE